MNANDLATNDLADYVRAIQAFEKCNDSECIAERRVIDNSYLDDDIWIESVETQFRFKNGVVIERLVESDHPVKAKQAESQTLVDDAASNMVCAECWISYEVLTQPKERHITPRTKQFINSCQQAFWLKITAAQSS
ncbi:hypothetical protein A3K86_15870 [Photobacterium jeanii]|uniref:Uncharacterized protein n=2 Tax=Photobacterium jeanii TaxID=858640 RepID=A0A178K722_9GAMM|nr:hypothetical protein A3K86_15870 [Photobacterium jeanii]PST89290.1 hypothetical protein C9I91_14315 [Photobacterium jeanii]